MTPYQVIWSPSALEQLAAIWMSATNRTEITRAEHRVNQALTIAPQSAGHELSEGLWKHHDSPLLVFFEINDVHKAVHVTDVHQR